MAKTIASILLLLAALLLTPYLVNWWFDWKKEGDASPAQESSTIVLPRLKDSIADVQGYKYGQIKIGEQVWLADDLRSLEQPCTNGYALRLKDSITTRGTIDDFRAQDSPPLATRYDNSPYAHGLLYNFSSVRDCRLCPPGFRIPSRADWEQLIANLGSSTTAARALLAPDGMNLAPAGRLDGYGFVLAGQIGFYWTSDTEGPQAVVFEIFPEEIYKFTGQDVRIGCYVRCVGM